MTRMREQAQPDAPGSTGRNRGGDILRPYLWMLGLILASGLGWTGTTAAAVGLGTELEPLVAEATRGQADAQFELALRYEMAVDIAANLDKAVALYCRAAGQGHAEAAFHVGWMYLTGLGVSPDQRLAAAWFETARRGGSRDAETALKLLSRHGGPVKPTCDPRFHPNGPPFAGRAGVIVPSGPPVAPEAIAAFVRTEAPAYGLDPALVLAVMAVESGFDSRSVSRRSAQGLMQLIPETAQRFGVSDPFDPADNIRGGMRYLRYLLAYFRGDLRLALAGYNAGEGAVDRYHGIPPYAETIEYLHRIGRLYPESRHSYDPDAAPLRH